jgi:hypothetical protein
MIFVSIFHLSSVERSSESDLICDVQLDLKILWDGHLARLDRAGKMPTPQLVKEFNNEVAHCII